MVIDVRKRLRRMRWPFHRCIHIKQLSQPGVGPEAKSHKFWIQSALGSPKRWRMRHRRLPTTRPTRRGLQEPICPRKKCVIWTRWRPVPVKNANDPRTSSSRRSGLVGPHTTPPIVNYKYMPSTPREGYFGPTTLGNICIWTARKSVGRGTNDRIMVHGDGTRADGRRSKFYAHL